MNRILTTPAEIDRNQRVLYAGNHYISLPEIGLDGSLKSLNLVSLKNKGLGEITGKESLLKPCFFRDGRELIPENVKTWLEASYIPCFRFSFGDNLTLIIKIYADLHEKGFVYEFESSEKIDIKLHFTLHHLNLLRFNAHPVNFTKEFKVDKWLQNPALNIFSDRLYFSLAFGGDKHFTYDKSGDDLNFNLTVEGRNALYITLNSDMDGASTTLIHFRRKGFDSIYSELLDWLKSKEIAYPKDPQLEKIMNENLFFNYFFAISKDMESDRYICMTSRSPRYYVSGAFWERDSFLWSFPAVRLVDKELYKNLSREMIIMHSKNPGDHAHYIDGTVLYPGFELDEAASHFMILEDMEEVDDELLRAIERILSRIDREYDLETGLYKTFLMPSDDPSEHPFLTIDNVILWRGLRNLRSLYARLGLYGKSELMGERISLLKRAIQSNLIREVEGKRMFIWSTDGKRSVKLYNDPPGNLGLLAYYDFVSRDDEVFKNTIDYYYSPSYKYYFMDAEIQELACDHHPNTPSGLGLCGSILNPLTREIALKWLKSASMDYGLLSESFDRNTGEAKTGVGFATGSGYLAFALHHVLLEED